MDKIVPLPIRMGVYDKLPPLLANSLGSYETTLIRMVTGYSEFVNGGKKISASLIDRIQDREGRTIWRHDQRDCEGCNDANWHGQQEPLLADTREQVLDPRTAYQIVSMLEGVVQRGTGQSVKAVGKPLAGKTGTSSDSQSVWFIGFSPDLAAGVYVGFDNPRTLGKDLAGTDEQGAGVAAPIFRDFMKGALADAPPTPFRVAPGIEEVPVDWKSGNPVPAGTPGAIIEAFKSGTAPGEADAPGMGVVAGDDSTTVSSPGPAIWRPGRHAVKARCRRRHWRSLLIRGSIKPILRWAFIKCRNSKRRAVSPPAHAAAQSHPDGGTARFPRCRAGTDPGLRRHGRVCRRGGRPAARSCGLAACL